MQLYMCWHCSVYREKWPAWSKPKWCFVIGLLWQSWTYYKKQTQNLSTYCLYWLQDHLRLRSKVDFVVVSLNLAYSFRNCACGMAVEWWFPFLKSGTGGHVLVTGGHTALSTWESLFQGVIREELHTFCPGCGTVDELFSFAWMLKGFQEFAHPECMCFVYLQPCLPMSPVGVYGVPGPFLWAIQSLYSRSEGCVRILSTKSNTFLVGVKLHQGFPRK